MCIRDRPYGEPLLELRMRLATEAHMKARQRLDLRRDLSAKLLQSHTVHLQVGQNIWYWDRDMTKIRGGEWLRGKVLEFDPTNPMVKIELNEDHKGRRQFWCNRSKVKRNPDPWHDVIIPGLANQDIVKPKIVVPPLPAPAGKSAPPLRIASPKPRPSVPVVPPTATIDLRTDQYGHPLDPILRSHGNTGRPAGSSTGAVMELVNICKEAGVPPGVVNLLSGDPAQISSELIKSDIIKKISITGSTRVGKLILKQAADKVQRVTMELSGHSPFIAVSYTHLTLPTILLV